MFIQRLIPQRFRYCRTNHKTMSARSTQADLVLQSIVDDMNESTLLIDMLFDMGYHLTFELVGSQLMCSQTRQLFDSREFMVDDIYRFDNNKANILGYVLYTLTHRKRHLKGIFTAYPVNGFSCP